MTHEDETFIFTLKNPHGVEPTRFMKKKKSNAIWCISYFGPIFGSSNADILINDKCDVERSYTYYRSDDSYDCHFEYHPKYENSLFVNTAGPKEANKFKVMDYEVYSFDICKEYVYNTCKHPEIIWKCFEEKDISKDVLSQFNDSDELLNDMDAINFFDDNIRLKISQFYKKNYSELLPDTHIVDQKYDSYLREWAGDYKWKLLHRASEHEYTPESFHKHCDSKGPTLVIIKSSKGWIFGGYTTQSWSDNPLHGGIYDIILFHTVGINRNDDKAFIFTLRNPHGVEPTRFMKKKESQHAILCSRASGPLFGTDRGDIVIGNNCTQENSCWISPPYYFQYECHPEYKSSLFVNTNMPNHTNEFSVLDYEVYSFDMCKEYVYNTCKYPDVTWNYIETKDIPEESLKLIDSEDEIRNDLDLIQCVDPQIRLKISRYYLNDPSKYLPDTQIVNQQYDSYLEKWLGIHKWKLLYRASEHGYSGRSFHEYCDGKRPTLVIIKSTGGWIFGGCTTQSWRGNSILSYDLVIIARCY